jgi:acetyltransferase-like isoleucine patch superfamily enzyme
MNINIPQKKEKVVLFGIGQNAEVAHTYLTYDSPYEISAFTVDSDWIDKDNFHNLPVVPFERIESLYTPEKYKMFIPISYTDINKLRKRKYFEAKEKGYQFISYICSKATTWPGLEVGDNCFIFEDNVIQPYAKIGENSRLCFQIFKSS